jgi:hypothetical protein
VELQADRKEGLQSAPQLTSANRTLYKNRKLAMPASDFALEAIATGIEFFASKLHWKFPLLRLFTSGQSHFDMIAQTRFSRCLAVGGQRENLQLTTRHTEPRRHAERVSNRESMGTLRAGGKSLSGDARHEKGWSPATSHQRHKRAGKPIPAQLCVCVLDSAGIRPSGLRAAARRQPAIPSGLSLR